MMKGLAWHSPCQFFVAEDWLDEESCRRAVQILLIKYGLVAVLMASFVDADVVSILAGVAAHRGFFVVATVLFSLGVGLSASASRVLTDVRRLEVVLLASVGLVALFFLLLRKFTPGTLSGTSTGEDHT